MDRKSFFTFCLPLSPWEHNVCGDPKVPKGLCHHITDALSSYPQLCVQSRHVTPGGLARTCIHTHPATMHNFGDQSKEQILHTPLIQRPTETFIQIFKCKILVAVGFSCFRSDYTQAAGTRAK